MKANRALAYMRRGFINLNESVGMGNSMMSVNHCKTHLLKTVATSFVASHCTPSSVC